MNKINFIGNRSWVYAHDIFIDVKHLPAAV